MNAKLTILLIFLLTASTSANVTEEPGTQSIKYTKYYERQFKQAQKHFEMAKERNLQMVRKNTNPLLRTNLTHIVLRRPEVPDLEQFLTDYSNGHLRTKSLPDLHSRLTPVFNRFQIRRRTPAQTACSLNVRVGGLQNFFVIGVVLVRFTFFSTCQDTPYTKFIWVNSFDQASHLRLKIDRLMFTFIFGNVTPERSRFRALTQFNSYKMLSLFRAANFNLRRVRRRPGWRRRPKQSGRRLAIRRRQARVTVQTGNTSPAPRKLVDSLFLKDETIKSGEEAEKQVNTKPLKKRKLFFKKMGRAIKGAAKKVGRNVGKPFRRLKKRNRRPRKRNGRPRKRNRRPRKRNRRRRRRSNRRRGRRVVHRSFVRKEPVQNWWQPQPVRRHDGFQVFNPQAQLRDHQQQLINNNQRFTQFQIFKSHVNPTPPRRRNLHRRFANLLNHNDESSAVFMRRVQEPINILPRIPWRLVGQRREILSSGNIRLPAWKWKTIRRIWRGNSPQIAESRILPILRDGIITCRL